jgi:hypothetical protein
MIKKCLALCVGLIFVADVMGQSRSGPVKQARPVKQPREVIEASRVCSEFQQILTEDLDFDRAFEATFIKDPARRRVIAMDESELRHLDLTEVDTDTLLDIYKNRTQLLILLLPLLFARIEEKAELAPPQIEAILNRKSPNEHQELKAFAAQLKQDVTVFRAHVYNLAANKPLIAQNIGEYKKQLAKPVKPPNHIVKPLTAYSKGRVLRVDEPYYQTGECAVVRENGQMRLIGYTFFRMRG